MGLAADVQKLLRCGCRRRGRGVNDPARLQVEQTVHAIDAAKRGGVRHVVDLSSIGAGLQPMPEMGRWHFDREPAVG